MSEKTHLQTALALSQQATRPRTGEAEDLAGLARSSQQHVGGLEWTPRAVSTQQKQVDRCNEELPKTCDAPKLEFYQNNKANDNPKQENSELQKLRVSVTDKEAMQLGMEEKQKKKLETPEVLLQQFPSQSDTPESKGQ